MATFHLVSLGCAKNRVDSEVMLGALQESGWEFMANPEDADVLLLNTCGFIQPAVEEAIEEILALAEIKAGFPEKKLVVVGCLVQRYRDTLIPELPEVDLFLGTEGPEMLPALLEQLRQDSLADKVVLPSTFLMSSRSPRQLTTPHMAWLKITEGCDNRCAFCKIPSIRGPLRSRRSDDLVEEAIRLAAQGAQELCIIAQDTTAYGNDLGGREHLQQLLEKLLAHTSFPWLRLLYLYPTGVSDELLSLVAEEARLVPYLDIPFQHVSDAVLRRMNRHHCAADLDDLLARLQKRVPNLALRTTFLVGFPGETESDFLELETFLRRHSIDHVGVFPYCDEEGTPASRLSGQIPEEERLRRQHYLLEIQSEISRNILQKYVGRIEPVLVEGVSGESDLLLAGRTRFQAPEVDGLVYINDGIATPGEIVPVEITEAHQYDLVGRVASS